MRRRLVWALTLLLLGMLAQAIYAQGITLEESEFWERLEQTDVLVQVALTQLNSRESADAAAELWDDVGHVRTADGIIDVDMSWIRLSTGSPEALGRLQRQIRALLNDRARRVPGSPNAASLSALDEVLKDERFQYDSAVVPTQIPDVDIPMPNVSPGFGQIALLIISVIVAVGVVLYFARNLQVQAAELDISSDDEPKTSASAVDMAESHANSRDYRTAMRYLYLSSLLLLNEKGLIHYDSTLTNREHLRQVRNQPDLHDLLRRVVNTFEDVWYGFAPVNESQYQQYVNTVEQLRRFVP